MHDRYRKCDTEWVASPTLPRYLVSVDGRIKDSLTGEVLPRLEVEGEPRVWLETPIGSGEGLIAKFVMEVYKPHFVPELLARGKVHYAWIDGDRMNCHVGNLIWLYDGPIEVPNREGYFYIPDYTRYGISRDGVIVRIADDYKTAMTTSPDGYVSTSMSDDNGAYSNSVGRHRCMATTFNGYDVNLYDMVTNHINGIPGDDRSDNVEICTYSDNITHAYVNALRSDNIHVGVKDHLNGVVTSFYSYGRAAEFIGCSPSNIHYCFKQDASYLFRDRWQFSLTTEDGEYVFPPVDIKVCQGRGSVIQLMDSNGVISTYPSMKAAAVRLGVSSAKFIEYIKSDCQLWYSGHRGKQSLWSEWRDISDYKQPIEPAANLFATYKITNTHTNEFGYYFKLKTVDLPGWSIKQLEPKLQVSNNTWRYKHYLIEKLPPPFKLETKKMSPLEETQEVVSH